MMHRITSYVLLTFGAIAAPIVGSAQAPPATVRQIATLTGVDGNQVVLMPNGRVILYTEGDSVVGYDLTTKRSTLVTHGWWSELAISRAGDRIAYGHPSEDGKIPSHIWTLSIDPRPATPSAPPDRS
jgi:hypothetical protein